MPSLDGGGAERVTLDLCRGLAARGHEVVLVLVNAEGELREEVLGGTGGFRVVDLGLSRTVLSVVALARHLRASRPDVVVGVLLHAALVGLMANGLARLESRFVVMVHNQMSVSTRNSPRKRDRLMPLLGRLGLGRADTITAVSRGVADDFAASTGIDRRRVHVFHNPIDFERIRRRGEEPLPSWWHDGGGHGKTLVAAGRLAEQKDFVTLLDAVAQMRHPDVRLAILGEGPGRDRLQAQVDRLGLGDRVVLPGFVTNPFPIFRAADAFVLSSRWEGLPTVLLEVMAFDTTIVSTDCPSGPREILDDGRYGTLVPVADPAALAAALDAALAEDRPLADRRPVREHFSLASVAERFESTW